MRLALGMGAQANMQVTELYYTQWLRVTLVCGKRERKEGKAQEEEHERRTRLHPE
jgi:hypothetical protein